MVYIAMLKKTPSIFRRMNLILFPIIRLFILGLTLSLSSLNSLINPGSTSTKTAVYEDEELIWESKISHNVDEIIPFPTVYSQKDFRMNLIISELENAGISLTSLDAITARGGMLKPLESGTYSVNQEMADYLKEAFDKALNGEIDALPAIGKTSEREQHFLFSEPYYYFKRVLVTRADDKAISGMEDLAGLTVAVQKKQFAPQLSS